MSTQVETQSDGSSAPPPPSPPLPPLTRQQALARAQWIEPWQQLKQATALALAAPVEEAGWLDRVRATQVQLRELTSQDTDAALYLMLQTATSEFDRYSACHAMFCSIVAELCARWLEWPEAETATLCHAALTMNIGMQTAQDAMARQTEALSEEQRRAVDEHPVLSEKMLRSAGVDDALWLETVLRHHQPIADGESGEPVLPAQRLAQLLLRIDVFTAKLSRRKTRPGATATVAARDACLGPGGQPDAIGVTMLRVLGLYPPGSFVLLANHEIGVVTGRGAKAHTPSVACLRRADGALLRTPTLRDTGERVFNVRRSLSSDEVKIAVNHERTLAAWRE